MLAKHFPEKFEWLVLSDNRGIKHQAGKKGNKKKQNLRNSPFHLKDGDTIGVKVHVI